MKLAIQGCSHGELDAIYASVLRAEREQGIQVDALLLCGDFQAIRNHADLEALAVPAKYRQLGCFHSYYSGERVAPILTLVIGGNHEASNYMHELYHGGWLAPNIYFLGAAGAVELNGLTIAGISGIYKSHDYNKGRFERVPYDQGTIRSCYHTRVFDIHRLKLMSTKNRPVDVVLSHDWPNTIENHGDTQALIKKKPFFRDEINSQTLGSPPLMELLQTLKPDYWFSAHLHVKFSAVYSHNAISSSSASTSAPAPTAAAPANPEAIDIDLDFDEDQEPNNVLSGTSQIPAENQPSTEPENTAHTNQAKVTRFLALHKCLPQSSFLQFLDIEAPGDAELEARKAALGHQERVMPTFRYSARWLAITKVFAPMFSLTVRQPALPNLDDPELLAKIAAEEADILANLAGSASTVTRNGGKRKQDEPDGSRVGTPVSEGSKSTSLTPQPHGLDIHAVQQFVRTAPAPFEPGGLHPGPPAWYTNPQTEAFCHFLGIENKINPRPPASAFPPMPPQMHMQMPMHMQMHPMMGFEQHAQPGYVPFDHGLGAPGEDPTAKRHKDDASIQDPNALDIDLDDFDDVGEQPRSDDAPQTAADLRDGVTTLSDNEDELNARWKEGTG
ncbi:hypothetical protein BCV70DRAFT_199435 [Testicularia cyperi]|uniref:Lariat debranching enzyme C-terminal domain-containing protein n=1 Tax=Testicularia cyperi TaxID=1882483 RepID=A0A317XRZ3_9BASI|nr:hypothetical protein BCV70DRAFT_199435 [Testicularia cyperi]